MIHRRAFLLTPLALATGRAAQRQPNVVLIVARGWRGVSTPWWNDPDLHAPNLSKFADTALVFPRAYCAAPSPGPARSAIATGRYPHVNGAVRDGVPVHPDELTISAGLGNAGYHAIDGIPALANPPKPFYATVLLDPPRATNLPTAELELRENIPAEFKNARELLAAYYGTLGALDEQLGKALAAAPSDALVIFTSDCGVQIGSHGIAGDDVPFEESVRVPLAIRFPGVIAPGANESLVSHVDLLPTLLALCGQQPFEGIQGHDLSPILTNAPGDRPEWIFAEGKIGGRDEWRMLLQGMDKIVVDAGGDVLEQYNLAADPYELTNRAQDSTQQLKRDQLLAVLRGARAKLLDFRRR